jgi:hypothetical protein
LPFSVSFRNWLFANGINGKLSMKSKIANEKWLNAAAGRPHQSGATEVF